MTEEADQLGEALDPRTYFAAERTLLAWVRTGLAMMGFGFVVARFGLFMRELAVASGTAAPHRVGVSLQIGTTLVVLGVAVNIAAAVKHWSTVRRLERGLPLRFSVFSLGMTISVVLGLFGLVTAFYLLFGLEH